MSRTVIALYTGTGNTLYVARFFKDAEIHFIDKILDGSDSLDDDIDRLGIMFPTYFLGIPYPVKQFVENYLAHRDNSKLGYLFCLTTNGGTPYAHLYAFDSLIQKIGLNLSYGATIKMPNAYLKTKLSQVSEMEALAFATKMKRKTEKVVEEIEREEIKLPKNLPFGRTIGLIAKKLNKTGKKNDLSLDDSCIGCGTCYRICPMHNIKITDNKALFGDCCITCYACYHRCPVHAINFATGLKTQYKGLQDTKELWRR